MWTFIWISIFAYFVLNKSYEAIASRYHKHISSVDWHAKAREVYNKLHPYAMKAGRQAAKPLLQFYYVMQSDSVSNTDRAIIYGALAYVILPVSFLPFSSHKLLGLIDEAAAIALVSKRITPYITPAISAKVDDTLCEWFGIEFEEVALYPTVE